MQTARHNACNDEEKIMSQVTVDKDLQQICKETATHHQMKLKEVVQENQTYKAGKKKRLTKKTCIKKR